MCAELDNHWEVVSEAIQTILRKHGQSKAYEQLKEFTRGEAINRKILADYILELDIPKEDKDKIENHDVSEKSEESKHLSDYEDSS